MKDTWRLIHPDGTEDLTNFNPVEEAVKKAKIWCSECGEDEASVCKYCYQDAIETGRKAIINEILSEHNNNICCEGCYLLGKKSAEDIKQNQLADHYQAGRKEALQDVEKMINDLINDRKKFKAFCKDNFCQTEYIVELNKVNYVINTLDVLKQKLHSLQYGLLSDKCQETKSANPLKSELNSSPDTFNLSKHERHSELGEVYYPKVEVKEFIRLLKEKIFCDGTQEEIYSIIDALAGDKLIEEKKQ
jgi:hypothetical protein